MAGITFPDYLQTEQTQVNATVSAKKHNSQITTLEARDQYVLDFLSQFDAIPIGTIMPTTINYTENGEGRTMPDGWVWADGRELPAKDYPKLFNLIKDSIVLYDDYMAWCREHDFTGDYSEPRGFYTLKAGCSINDIDSAVFRIPNLRGVYIRGIGSTQNQADLILPGQYLDDTIKSHTHQMTAFPVNGVDLTNRDTDIGVALTDRISSVYNNLPVAGKFTSDSNEFENTLTGTIAQVQNPNMGTVSLLSETRPKSIAYRYMLKVEFKNPLDDGSANVETDASSVWGYVPSPTPPEDGNPSAKKFPVPDPTTGKIDPEWFDVSSLSRLVVSAPTTVETLESIIDEKSVLSERVSETPIAGIKTIPESSTDGKLSFEFLDLTQNTDIDTLFS